MDGFSFNMFVEACVLTGCDYYEALPNMGVVNVFNYMKKHGSTAKVFDHLIEKGTTVKKITGVNF